MAQINDFSGGLSTRLNPAYIQLNEGVIYKNIDPSSNTLKPLKAGRLEQYSTGGTKLYIFKDKKIYYNDDRSFVKFSNKLYYSDGSGIPKATSDGETFYNLTIAPPVSPIRATPLSSAGDVTGTVQYCYTYYDSATGSESGPSEYSREITVNNNQVNLTVRGSADARVTDIIIYRIGNTLLDMFEITRIANSYGLKVVIDNTADLDATYSPLTTQGWTEAPIGLKYLTESGASLFGAVDNKLYFTLPGEPEGWSNFNYITTGDNITGLSDSPFGLLVFTKYETYLATLGGPTGAAKILLSGTQGCVSHSTIQYVNNLVVWLSTDGICMTADGTVNLVSQDKLGYMDINSAKGSAVLDEIYYIGFNSTTYALDTQFDKRIIRQIDLDASSFTTYNDSLYYIKDGNLYTLGKGLANMNMHYKSGNLAEGSLTNLKTFKNYYVNVKGTLTFKLYIDDTLLTTTTVSDGVHELRTPGKDRNGYTFSFEVIGDGELLEFEFKAEGRQNGR